MDAYKKIIRNKETRLKILRMFNWIPDKTRIKIQYFIKTHRPLNLKNPKRWTEKCQWYKLYYHDPLMTKCADKYLVREYVESKGLGYILNDLYGVYDSPDDINLDELPDEFVLKVNSGCGANIIVNNKSSFDFEAAKERLNEWICNSKKGTIGAEWVYKNIDPKIIAEKYLYESEMGLIDYKFFCFNGEVSHLLVISDRFGDEKLDLYDADFNRLNVIQFDCPNQSKTNFDKPENYDDMIKIAQTLSADFPHVRVDLYNISGKIYFGELTFYSGSGYYIFKPDSFDFELGEKFILPQITK